MNWTELAAKYNLLGDDKQIYRLGRTDYLVTRELPAILSKYNSDQILDLGCGTGLSTRFIKKLGYKCIGVDTSNEMLAFAKQNDSDGTYIKSNNETPLAFENETFDVVVSIFVLFEIPSIDIMKKLFLEISRILKKNSTFIAITGSEELYKRNWVTLNTNFPENKNPNSGDICRIELTQANIILNDYFWKDDDYSTVAKNTGFHISGKLLPLGKPDDGIDWLDETNYAPFVFYEFTKK